MSLDQQIADLDKRLRSVRYVRETWFEPHGTTTVPCDEDDEGAEAVLRNPNGPEAADTIASLRAELEEARGLLSKSVAFIGWSGAPDGLVDEVHTFLAKQEPTT